MKSQHPFRRTTHAWAIALLTAAGGLGLATCTSSPEVTTSPTGTTPVTNELDLRNEMRRLWVEQAVWTRVFIADSVAELPDTGYATSRLLTNQVDLGNAIKPFYGEAAGNELGSLLYLHVSIAADVVAAVKAHDPSGLADANNRWHLNADRIALFLADANPTWTVDDLKLMMNELLEQTLTEAQERVRGASADDIGAYEKIVHDAIGMADVLTSGMVQQFPDKIAASPSTAAQETLQVGMRALWEDHVSWTRFFLIDAIAGLPDTGPTADRLLRNQVDIGNFVKPYYGEAAGNRLAALLHDHITLAAAVVVDAKGGYARALISDKRRWYENADQIAAFLAAANPNWSLRDLDAMMKQHLDRTFAEASARLSESWADDVADYDAIESDILGMADTLSDGISKQFPAMVE